MSAGRAPGASPWTRTDALAAASVIAAGCVVWAIGWYRVSDQPAFEQQIAPLNLAIVGIVIVGAGQITWFLGGRRAVHSRRRVLLGEDAAPILPTERVAEPAGTDALAGSERFYHRLDCPMVTDRAWIPTSRAAHELAGRVPCGVCAP